MRTCVFKGNLCHSDNSYLIYLSDYGWINSNNKIFFILFNANVGAYPLLNFLGAAHICKFAKHLGSVTSHGCLRFLHYKCPFTVMSENDTVHKNRPKYLWNGTYFTLPVWAWIFFKQINRIQVGYPGKYGSTQDIQAWVSPFRSK